MYFWKGGKTMTPILTGSSVGGGVATFPKSQSCQPWVWHMFWKWTCYGLCGLRVFKRVWLKHQSSFNHKLGHLSDTLQVGAWFFPPFRKWPDHMCKLTHVASLHFLPSGQNGLSFGYCFSGPLPLRFHKGQVTFLEPFPGVPSHLNYTQKLAKSILALKLSVTTTGALYFLGGKLGSKIPNSW